MAIHSIILALEITLLGIYFTSKRFEAMEYPGYICMYKRQLWGFVGCSGVKNLPTKVRDAGLIPGSGSSPGEGNGNPLQYSCLAYSMDRGVGRLQKSMGLQKSWTQLSN